MHKITITVAANTPSEFRLIDEVYPQPLNNTQLALDKHVYKVELLVYTERDISIIINGPRKAFGLHVPVKTSLLQVPIRAVEMREGIEMKSFGIIRVPKKGFKDGRYPNMDVV